MFEIKEIPYKEGHKESTIHYVIFDADSKRFVIDCYSKECAEGVVKILTEDRAEDDVLE